MRYEKNRKIAGMDELQLQKLFKFLIIPFIAIVLIIVIVIADHNKGGADKTTAVAASSQTETEAETAKTSEGDSSASVEADNNVYVNDFANYGLQKDPIPEIDELVAEYQQAKTEGDAELMYKVFGRTDTDGLDAMQTKLDSEKEVYDSYQDTICYTTAGVEEGSYLVYISSKVKFAGIDTPAPMLTWAYIVKGADGSYTMKETNKLTEEEQALVDEVSRSEDVAVLNSQMRSELAQAVVSDVKLAALYQIWAEGETSAQAEETTEAATEETESTTVEEATVNIVE